MTYYYFVSGFIYNLSFVDKLMKERGNWKKYNIRDKSENLDILLIGGYSLMDKNLWIKSTFKNLLDKKCIIEFIDKHSCYDNLKNVKEIKKYLLPQKTINFLDYYKNKKVNELKFFFKDDVYIFKPVSGWKGFGIEVFNDFDKFKKYFNDIIIKYQHKWKKLNKSSKASILTNHVWILQKYIIKPLLYNGKKFHLRSYFILFCDYNKTIKYYCRKVRIIHAKKKYNLNDFSDKDVHDTHALSTVFIDLETEFTKLYSKKIVDNIFKDIKDISNIIMENIKCNCYLENKICYQLFGLDLMLLPNFKVKLIELNDDPGFSPVLYNDFFQEILEKIIDVKYPPKNKIKKSKLNNFIKL
jgi:tubulin polyglutamylase TTLL9